MDFSALMHVGEKAAGLLHVAHSEVRAPHPLHAVGYAGVRCDIQGRPTDSGFCIPRHRPDKYSQCCHRLVLWSGTAEHDCTGCMSLLLWLALPGEQGFPAGLRFSQGPALAGLEEHHCSRTGCCPNQVSELVHLLEAPLPLFSLKGWYRM